MASNHPNHLLPVAALLFGATLWGVVWYPLRLLETAGLVGVWATLIIYIAATLVGLWIARGYLHQLRTEPFAMLLLTLVAGWCNIAFILAVLEGQVVRVLLMFYMSPVWTVILGRIFLSEKMGWMAYGVLGTSIVGALIMLWKPQIGGLFPLATSDWLALSAGMAFAASNVIVRKYQDVHVLTKTCTIWAGGVVVAGAAILFMQVPWPDASANTVVGALALGIGFFVVMTLVVQYGVTHLPVHLSAIILLFELVAGATSSHWLAGEVIAWREWAGGSLILLGAWLAARQAMTYE